MRRVRLMSVLGIVLWTAPTRITASTVIFSDQDYTDANWIIPDYLFLDPSKTGQRSIGGDPGGYRQTALIYADKPNYSANLNTTFVYTPATQGAITAITYNMDLKVFSGIGSTYYALISQDGRLFYDPIESAYDSENIWLNHELLLKPGDFVPLHENRPAVPDFVAGSTITFGYLVTAGYVLGTHYAEFNESVTGIDNDPITVTTRSHASVPEPPSALLLSAGIWAFSGALGWRNGSGLAGRLGSFHKAIATDASKRLNDTRQRTANNPAHFFAALELASLELKAGDDANALERRKMQSGSDPAAHWRMWY